MERYVKIIYPVHHSDDPIMCWTKEDVVRNYPLLSVIAIDILIIPGSSALVERTFSTAGVTSSGKRNRLAE